MASAVPRTPQACSSTSTVLVKRFLAWCTTRLTALSLSPRLATFYSRLQVLLLSFRRAVTQPNVCLQPRYQERWKRPLASLDQVEAHRKPSPRLAHQLHALD